MEIRVKNYHDDPNNANLVPGKIDPLETLDT